jgi:hypothetical protein
MGLRSEARSRQPAREQLAVTMSGSAVLPGGLEHSMQAGSTGPTVPTCS